VGGRIPDQRPSGVEHRTSSQGTRRTLEEGTIRERRVVDLYCGSCTASVFLAPQGFEVKGIDVAPTTITQAEQKARTFGVKAQWVVGDVLSPPELKPFDVIYNRGCYHVLRDQNLTAYLETIRRLPRPGTLFLLLAARVEDKEWNRNQGGVTEDEPRMDFADLFEFRGGQQSQIGKQ
jgi:methyl halide transferase